MKPFFKRILLIIGGTALASTVVACGPRHHHEPEEHAAWMAEKISEELELNTDQQAQLTRLKDTVLSSMKAMHAQRDSTHKQLHKLLSAEEFNRDEALNLVLAKTEFINTQAPGVINAFGDFYDSLNQEQRAELRKHFDKKSKFGHRPHHW